MAALETGMRIYKARTGLDQRLAPNCQDDDCKDDAVIKSRLPSSGADILSCFICNTYINRIQPLNPKKRIFVTGCVALKGTVNQTCLLLVS